MGTTTSLVINGRQVLLYTPVGIAANAPLVLALHPGGTNATLWQSTLNLDAEADTGLFYVLYVNGHGNPSIVSGAVKTWWCGFSEYPCCGYAGSIKDNDVEFIRLLIERVPELYSIDRTKIYLSGFSNGGMLSYSYIMSYPADIAGMTILASCYIGVSGEAVATSNKKVMHIYGTTDTVIPPAGGASSETDPYNHNDSYQFPSLANWQSFLTSKGIVFNTVALSGVGHTFASLQTALGVNSFESRIGDMVAGTGTWA